VGTIVCGIDDSPGAAEAVRVAAGLSDRLRMRLVLAHVASGWSDGVGESLSTSQARAGGSRLLDRFLHEQRVRAERRLEVGDPVELLGRIAAEEAANMIVIGSRRDGWRGRKLRSGIAGDLVASAPCPVLVVPPRGAARFRDGPS
jgi:nucleotide-binding universal stress UspA family protein